ncbi:MAG: asparagine synthase [Okeania sp. SIO3I5]|uniref:asparagine synthetase B family protein n=1 Tax=Okeania sp. SIO3I5 TaxID=2607805 RepID=UPI0013BC976B|nr:asparagine synthase-related protein [Okeania sp. SIO3I5]NEQ36015.1 asparagine synthase [Okeania sp. SIO3I5]
MLFSQLNQFIYNNNNQLNINLIPNWHIVFNSYSGAIIPDNFLIKYELKKNNTRYFCYEEEHLLIIGDIWLTNQTQLYSELNLNYQYEFKNDYELILKLWSKLGRDCLNLLEGMFAFSIWDNQEQKLFLVRDGVGSRTLYYCQQSGNYYIAPRLKTLLPFHSQELNLVALRDYLTCSFVPGENTLWNGVKELRPGSVLTLPTGKIDYYWQPEQNIKYSQETLEFHGDRLKKKLEEVVREYLPKKQSIGIYLSGGLDSSCITALCAKFHQEKIHTYSIHFGAECPNELEFSRLVAKHCQTEHHILEITPQKMWDNLPITLANLDDPIGDPLTFPNYLLAQVAQENSQVILNGEGGDPCFGGLKNQPMILSQLYGNSSLDSNLLNNYLTSFKKCFVDLPNLLKPDIYQQVETEQSVFIDDLISSNEFVNRLMWINIKFKGADHILTKVNNLTCSANLIGLSPLFDKRIVQLSMEIPPQYKLKGSEEKAVLKQAVADLLPEAIVDRPKSGMRVPVQYFFYRYWRNKAKRLLLSRKAKIADYLNQDLIKEWLNYRGDVWGRYGLKLELLISL